MICQHHKITPWRGDGGGLVECCHSSDSSVIHSIRCR